MKECLQNNEKWKEFLILWGKYLSWGRRENVLPPLHNRENYFLFPSLFLFYAHFTFFTIMSTTSKAFLFAFISLVWLHFPPKILHSIQACLNFDSPFEFETQGIHGGPIDFHLSERRLGGELLHDSSFCFILPGGVLIYTWKGL